MTEQERLNMIGMMRRALLPIIKDIQDSTQPNTALLEKVAESIPAIYDNIEALNKAMIDNKPEPTHIDLTPIKEAADRLATISKQEVVIQQDNTEIKLLMEKMEAVLDRMDQLSKANPEPKKKEEPAAVNISNLKEFKDMMKTTVVTGGGTKFPFKSADGSANVALGLKTAPNGTPSLPVVNPDGSLLAPGKDINAYAWQATSDDGTYKYFYFEDSSLNYYIMRKHKTNKVADYTKGTGGYTTAYNSPTTAPQGTPNWASYGATF